MDLEKSQTDGSRQSSEEIRTLKRELQLVNEKLKLSEKSWSELKTLHETLLAEKNNGVAEAGKEMYRLQQKIKELSAENQQKLAELKSGYDSEMKEKLKQFKETEEREKQAGVLLKTKDEANASLQALLTRMNGKLDELVLNLQKSEA